MVTAQNLARHFENVDRLFEADAAAVEEVDGTGSDRAESIATWFADEKNRALVAELRQFGLAELGEDDRPRGRAADGKTYVVTGTLAEKWSREQAPAAAEGRSQGAKGYELVSSKTTALIVGEEPGASKLTKAQRLGIELTDEAGLEVPLRAR